MINHNIFFRNFNKKQMKLMKSYVLIGLFLILSFVVLSSQPNVPRFENPQIDFKYTVVIGSMQKLENAEKLQRLAIENGYESFLAPVNIRNKQHYRVCVGLMQDFSESKKQLSVIKKSWKAGAGSKPAKVVE